jgi:hypothetical protein
MYAKARVIYGKLFRVTQFSTVSAHHSRAWRGMVTTPWTVPLAMVRAYAAAI